MNYMMYAGELLLFTVLFSILGVLIALWMEKNGFARKNYPITITGAFTAVLIKMIFFYADSWWIWSFAMIFALVFAFHRSDLLETVKKGRWWWRSKKDNEK